MPVAIVDNQKNNFMEYFSLLHLKKEPFSNSPDPELFFHSYQHESCLQKLELAIRLKRGLSVVLGDIGTGKSTLSRQLVRILAKDSNKIDAKLILDPEFTSPHEFLQTILKTFNINGLEDSSEWQMKEAIKNHLFEQGVDLKTVPVLIIDEGQKLPGFCLEILREFLNYETNQHKLLQIIIFAQEEFTVSLKEKANFADRITTLQHLRPLSLKETRQMIRFRIDQSRDDSVSHRELFSQTALLGIHLISKGYPRRIIMLCSKIIIRMLVDNKKKAGIKIVLAAARETAPPRSGYKRLVTYTSIISLIILIPIISSLSSEKTAVIKPQHPVLPLTPAQSSISQKKPKEIIIQTPEPTVKKVVHLPPKDTKPITIEPQIHKVKPSAILGHLTVEDGVSLGYMISSVYGKFTTKRTNAVIAANPSISDPNRIKFGTKINFPRLPSNTWTASGKFCIELTTVTTLQEGYDFIRNSKELSHELMIRPLPKDENILPFQVIMKQHYTTKKRAKEAVKQLPDEYEARVKEL